MSITDRLNELQAIAEKATPGPWLADESDEGHWVETPEGVIDTLHAGDSSFIATFRTAGPELIEGLKVAVGALERDSSCRVSYVKMPFYDCLGEIEWARENPDHYKASYRSAVLDGLHICTGCQRRRALARISAILEGGK